MKVQNNLNYVGTAIIATDVKITDMETMVEVVPIISGVVNFDKINQKKYAGKIRKTESMNKYAVPLPIFEFLKLFHHPLKKSIK